MLHVSTSFKKAALKCCSLFLLCLAVFAVKAKAGVDSYAIYLNQKLLLKQSVLQPLNVKSLHLDEANYNDQLVIYYSQCNAPNKIASGRSLAVKDAKGNTVKEWKFADATGSNTAMVIPVKELLQLTKKNGYVLGFYYTAQGMPEARLLTSLQIDGQHTGYHPVRENPVHPFAWLGCTAITR